MSVVLLLACESLSSLLEKGKVSFATGDCIFISGDCQVHVSVRCIRGLSPTDT